MTRKRKKIFNQNELANPDIYTTVSVKCALKNRVKTQKVYDQIQQDVTEMSSLAVEASRYIHFNLMGQFYRNTFPSAKIDFVKYFRDLCFNKRNRENPTPAWRGIRGDIPFYDNSLHRSNLMIYLAQAYERAFITNIKTHAYPRLRSFCKKWIYVEYERPYTDAEIRDTLAHVFYEDSDSIPIEALLDELRGLGWTKRELFNLNGYWVYLRIFYNLQKFNERNNIKSFKLIPIHHFGSIHIRYDQQSMFHLLYNLECIKSEPGLVKDKLRNKYSQNEDYRHRMWFKHFKPPERNNKIFDWTMQTDGVAVSFQMKTKRPKQSDERGDIDKIRRKMINGEYDVEIGLDPGYRLMVGGIARNAPTDHVNAIRHIKISSKEYHNRSGFTERKRLLDKWTTKEQSQLSSMSPAFYHQYAIYQMSIFTRKQREFSQRKVVRLKLKKYICVQKTCVALAKEIIGDNQNAFIAIGSTKFAPNSPIKGYRRVPHRQLTRELSKRADTIEGDEFRSTKSCAKCSHVNITSQSPHRYQFCPNCHTHWHRDINAGINILNNLKCEILGIGIHPNFSRATRLN